MATSAADHSRWQGYGDRVFHLSTNVTYNSLALEGFGLKRNFFPGFVPAAEALLVPQKGPNNGRALRDAPFTVPPRSAIFNCADAGNGGAPQLAKLGHGPPFELRVSSISRSEGGKGDPIEDCHTGLQVSESESRFQFLCVSV